MKFIRVILPFIMLLPVAAGFTSCSDAQLVDEPVAVVPSTPDEAMRGKYYINIGIFAAGDGLSSRAPYGDGEQVDGCEIEQMISAKGNIALFFDENKNLYSIEPLGLSAFSEPSDGVVERVYPTTILPDKDGNFPKYCMVVLNCEPVYDAIFSLEGIANADRVLELVWSDSNISAIGRTEKDYFTMSNSIYIDADNKLCSLVEITPEMIVDEDNPASKAEILTIYVERVLAKFNFEVSGKSPEADGTYLYVPGGQNLVVFNGFDDVTGAPKYISRTWSISLTGWNVNGLEKSTRLFKYINPTTQYFSDWEWKAPSKFRTYWSEDDNYRGSYPLQYRKSVYPAVNYYEDFEKRNVNSLRNFSFNELDLENKDFGKTLYTPENTYDYNSLKDALDKRADLLAGTHLIVGAVLKIDNITVPNYKGDVWRDREGFFYTSQKDCIKSMVYSFNSALESHDVMRFTFYNWGASINVGNNADIMYVNAKGKYKLYYDGKELTNAEIDKLADDILATGAIKGGDGKRMPWFKDLKLQILNPDNGNTLYVCDENGNNQRKINTDEICSLIFEWIGAFDHFNEGRMYYSAPATIRKAPEGSSLTNICGVVRNGWYYYSLSDVKNIGTPVDDPDQVIIPETVANKDQLNLTIKILDWHVTDFYYPILP